MTANPALPSRVWKNLHSSTRSSRTSWTNKTSIYSYRTLLFYMGLSLTRAMTLAKSWSPRKSYTTIVPSSKTHTRFSEEVHPIPIIEPPSHYSWLTTLTCLQWQLIQLDIQQVLRIYLRVEINTVSVHLDMCSEGISSTKRWREVVVIPIARLRLEELYTVFSLKYRTAKNNSKQACPEIFRARNNSTTRVSSVN